MGSRFAVICSSTAQDVNLEPNIFTERGTCLDENIKRDVNEPGEFSEIAYVSFQFNRSLSTLFLSRD
jgi:hypothetical protein